MTFCPSSRKIQLLPVKWMEAELCRCCSGSYLLVLSLLWVAGRSFSATFLDQHLQLNVASQPASGLLLDNRSIAGRPAGRPEHLQGWLAAWQSSAAAWLEIGTRRVAGVSVISFHVLLVSSTRKVTLAEVLHWFLLNCYINLKSVCVCECVTCFVRSHYVTCCALYCTDWVLRDKQGTVFL